MIRDELGALLMGFNQYKGGKGSDRANLVKIWSGDRIITDRVAHDTHIPIRCPHPTVSLAGGLPPDMLGEMADPKGRAEGFIDRFLACYPDPLPVADWSDRGIPEDVVADWSDLIARLWEEADALQGRPRRGTPRRRSFRPRGKPAGLSVTTPMPPR